MITLSTHMEILSAAAKHGLVVFFFSSVAALLRDLSSPSAAAELASVPTFFFQIFFFKKREMISYRFVFYPFSVSLRLRSSATSDVFMYASDVCNRRLRY